LKFKESLESPILTPESKFNFEDKVIVSGTSSISNTSSNVEMKGKTTKKIFD